jgi:RNA 3'-terminal phosphate cyclase (ATP)
MIEIDGSYGEGGGQILRTGVALSILTGKSVRFFNIRANRKPPGLKTQHQMSIQAAAALCGAKVEGAALGSTILTFRPGPVQPGEYHFDVSTLRSSAGSITLIFQTLLPILSFAERPSRLILQGGTDVPWSPPADYLRAVFLPTLSPMGIQVEMEIAERGFYPIGGGRIEALVHPAALPLRPLRIDERGPLKRLRIDSAVANLPRGIAERQLASAMDLLKREGFDPEREIDFAPSPGKGTFCFILAEFERVRVGFSSLGALGKRAERVGEEAAHAFLHYAARQGALDPHLGDQVVLYMALAEGRSVITIAEVTEHLRTNIWVIEQFLPVRFDLREDRGKVEVEGVGFRRS